jgi:hypothetical protein
MSDRSTKGATGSNSGYNTDISTGVLIIQINRGDNISSESLFKDRQERMEERTEVTPVQSQRQRRVTHFVQKQSARVIEAWWTKISQKRRDSRQQISCWISLRRNQCCTTNMSTQGRAPATMTILINGIKFMVLLTLEAEINI